MFDCIYRDEVKQKIKERTRYLGDIRIMNKGDTKILNQIGGFEKALDQIYCDIDDIRAADVQPVNRWISCQDKMPEPGKDVLVWYRYTWGAGFTSYRFGISKWYSNIKRWYKGCLPKDIEVLYWQPLSEPPKDGDVG